MKKRLTMMLIYIITVFSAVNFAQAPVITLEPINKYVIEGQTATFTIQAQGDSLTYQWYKNDTLVVGATDSAYTTPATVFADNMAQFNCIVTNPSGADTSNKATLYVTATGTRVTEGMQLLYTFDEGSGSTINDSSGVGTPYNLDIHNQSSVTWTPNGLGINSLPFITGSVPLSKVIQASQATNEITIEVWIQPTSVNYTDYPRIIALSDDAYSHNEFSLMQNPFGGFDFLIRTNNTDSKGKPGLVTPNNIVEKKLTHFVCTFSSNGERKIFQNGVQIASLTSAGNFSTWDTTARLQLANQTSENTGWLGAYYLVSIYNRALNQAEVSANYNVGVNADLKPEIIVEPLNRGTLVGQTVSFNVRAAGDSLAYQWRKNGVDIPGANLDAYTTPALLLTDDKAEYSCIVTNGYGADTSRSAQVRVNALNKSIEGGRLAVYTFKEGSGNIINDVLGYDPVPLRINYSSLLDFQWKPYGLILNPGANTVSASQATKWATDIGVGTGEFTFETWIKPENLSQFSSNILSIGNLGDTSRVNFVMEQNGNRLLSRLRTSKTSEYGAALETPANSFGDSLVHVVFIRTIKEVSQIYINGVQVKSDFQFGDLTSWNPVYYVRIGEQAGGTKPWRGLYNHITFYMRALSSNEIAHNYAFGPSGVSLKAPANLTAQVNEPGKVELAWDDSSNNEDGFIIERQSGVSNFTVIDSVGINVTSFTDSTVADTTIYTYRVKAYNYVYHSAYTNTASDTTLLSSIAAPSTLAAVLHPTIVNRALLSWQDNSSNELGFILERKTGDSASVNPYTVIDTLGAGIVSYTDSTLADTTTYTFRVKAFNEFFESAYSNVATISTVLSILTAPTNLATKLVGPNQEFVELNWLDNSTNELGFIIERKSGDTSVVAPFVIIDSVGVDVTTYTDTLVMLDSTYSYRVFAFNSYLASDYSNVSDVKVPVELVSFIADVINGAVQLRWETASETNNSGFSIQKSKDNSQFTDIAFVKGNGTTTDKSTYTYADKAALSGKYYYRLKQVDFDGSVTYSKSIEVDLGIPKSYALEQNYPNPFNPSTTIRFALPINAKVSLKLYNALGQEVTTILNTDLDAGVHEAVFNASNLSSGVYFYSLKVQGVNGSNFTSTKRMILMK